MKNKLFFLLIMLLAITAIISCGEPEDLKIEGNEKIFTDFEGVYLTLEGIGEASISVTWRNLPRIFPERRADLAYRLYFL